MSHHNKLGQEPVDRLLLSHALAACSGMLRHAHYYAVNTVDTIFIGRFVGSEGIAAVTIAFPISLLLPTIGMAIGAGGGSIISRSLGRKDLETARMTFGNGFILAITLCILATILCFVLTDTLLSAFGATEGTLQLARDYYHIALFGIPFMGSWMSMNQMLRSEGLAKQSVRSMWISSVINIVLDAVFIAGLDMGIKGAALATVIAQIAGWSFNFSVYYRKISVLRLEKPYFALQRQRAFRIVSIGSVTFGRNLGDAILLIILNKTL